MKRDKDLKAREVRAKFIDLALRIDTILLRVLRVVIKVTSVALAHDRRSIGSFDLSRVHLIPVHTLKPGMVLDICGPTPQVSVPLRQIRRQQPLQDIFQGRLEMRRVPNFTRHDLAVQLDVILVKEWWEPSTHFEHEHAHRPPIDGFAVSLGLDDLWSEVVGRAAEGPGHILGDMLGESKIGDLDVSHRVQQQVLGLEVAVDDCVRVQVFQRQQDLACVESRYVLREPLYERELRASKRKE